MTMGAARRSVAAYSSVAAARNGRTESHTLATTARRKATTRMTITLATMDKGKRKDMTNER